MKTLAIIPTYNECSNITLIVSQLAMLERTFDCLFVDDGSPDGTGVKIQEEAALKSWIFLLQRARKLGIGSAHLDGLEWARSHGYSHAVTLDCDLSHSPSDIPKMLEAATGADVVVGSRYLEKGSLTGWQWKRRFLTRTAHILTRVFLGIPYDCTGGFRVYCLEKIPPEIFQIIRAKDYSFFFESLFLLSNNGMRIAEVPICLPPRAYGSSKMPFDEPFRGIKRLMALGLSRFLQPESLRISHHRIQTQQEVEPTAGWDAYWSRSPCQTNRAYQMIATIYRRLVITRRLSLEVKRIFKPGDMVMHAGCGSGHVDEFNQHYVKITAVDTCRSALEIYTRCVPKAEEVYCASIFALPFADESFAGVYHLGVIEHFSLAEIEHIFFELRRVLRPDGRMLIFWPHQRATSVTVLKLWQRLAGNKNSPLHPPEPSLARGRKWVADILQRSGFHMESYSFGFSDFYVQSVIVARRASLSNRAAPTPRPTR